MSTVKNELACSSNTPAYLHVFMTWSMTTLPSIAGAKFTQKACNTNYLELAQNFLTLHSLQIMQC